MCPVITLRAYEEKTKPIRGNKTMLLISFIKPNNAVTSSSVAHWLKAVLAAARIDTDCNIFSTLDQREIFLSSSKS